MLFFFIISSFFFKIGIFPFHAWVPDVYDGASLGVIFLFSILPKFAVMIITARFFLEIFERFLYMWQAPILILSLTSIVLGGVAALGQGRIKRLLAFGSISHSGFMLIGLCSINLLGIQSIYIYLVVYALSNVIIFGILVGMKPYFPIRYIHDFSGLGFYQPAAGFAFSTAFLSAAGIPPIAGFFGKFFVFLAAISNSIYTSAFLAVIFSVISTYYYLKIIRIIYFDNISIEIGSFISYKSFIIKKDISIIVSLCTILLLFLFIKPQFLLLFSFQGALNFFM